MSNLYLIYDDEIELVSDDSHEPCLDSGELFTTCISCITTCVGVLLTIALIIIVIGKSFSIIQNRLMQQLYQMI